MNFFSLTFFHILTFFLISSCGLSKDKVYKKKSRLNIVGGKKINAADFPQLKMIYSKRSENLDVSCTGFYIHPQIMITAAHCLPKNPQDEKLITLGDKKVPIKRFYRHPLYEKDLYSLKDIGVIITEETSKYFPSLEYQDLIVGREDYLSNLKKDKEVFILGFGHQDDFRTKGELLVGHVQVKNFNRDEILTYNIKTFASGADSGGPAFIEDAKGKMRVIGLISRWKFFSNQTKGTYLTSLTNNRDFLCSVIKKESLPLPHFCQVNPQETEASYTNQIIQKKIKSENLSPKEIQKKIEETTELDLSMTLIKDLSPITKFKNLTTLNIAENLIDDISPLMKLPHLKKVDLSFNKIKRITLNGKSSLRVKGEKLQEGRIPNTKFLLLCLNSRNISKRTLLTIKGIARELRTPIKSYPNKNLCEKLNFKLLSSKLLNLSNLFISDISPLEGLPLLKYLDLSGNHIKDISPLLSLPSLIYTDLTSSSPQNINLLNTKGIKKRDKMIFHFQSFWERLE